MALPGAHADQVAVQLTSAGLQIDTTVSPPAPRTRMQVVRLEIPCGSEALALYDPSRPGAMRWLSGGSTAAVCTCGSPGRRHER